MRLAGSTRRAAVSCHASCRRVPDPNRTELRDRLARRRDERRHREEGRWRGRGRHRRFGGVRRGAPNRADERRGPQNRSRPPPSPTASPNIAPRVNTRTPCGSRHARAPGALGNERRQVQSSQQLGVTLGQPGGLAGNAPRFLPPDRKRQKTDARRTPDPEAPGSERHQVQSSQQLGAKLGQLGGSPRNCPKTRLGSCPLSASVPAPRPETSGTLTYAYVGP